MVLVIRPHGDRGDPGLQGPGTWKAWLLVLLVFGALSLVIGASVASTLLYPPYWTERLPVLNASGQALTLTEYGTAKNVSYGQLCAFLANDTTETAAYAYPNHTCGDFAVRLHDAAEARGIRSGLVAVILNTTGYPDGAPGRADAGVVPERDRGHAFNAFNTTDRGLVFIDATGVMQSEKGAGRPPQKMVAYFEGGMPLGEIALNQSEGLDYPYYRQRESRYALYVRNVSRFNDEVRAFNAEERTFNDTVNGYYRDFADFSNQYHSFGIALNYSKGSGASENVTSGGFGLWREVLADKLLLLDARYDAIRYENRTLEEERQRLEEEKTALEHREEAKWVMNEPLGVVESYRVYW